MIGHRPQLSETKKYENKFWQRNAFAEFARLFEAPAERSPSAVIWRCGRLRHFDHRDFHRPSLSLGHGASLFIADNAEGKTNLLEYVYLLATMKELRAETEAQVIRREVTDEPIRGVRGGGGGILSVTASSGRVVGGSQASRWHRPDWW